MDPKSSANDNTRLVELNSAQILLQTAFSQFVQSAEIKLNSFIYENLEEDVDIASPLEPGYDEEFDEILQNLGSTAQHCPKLLVDCIMAWRKTKSDTSDASVSAIMQAAASYDGSPARIGSPLEIMATSQTLMNKEHFIKAVQDVKKYVGNSNFVARARDVEILLKERKSLVANFVLCRALTEVLQNLRPDTLPNNLGMRLEDMIFAQLKAADPELLAKYPNRHANLDFFAQVIGQLSNIRFATVSDRFIKELSPASMPKESKIEMLLRCMRFIDLKIYPMEALEETADFLQILADFFKNSPVHSQVKYRYAELFVDLLEPVAAVAVAEVNMPIWKEAVESIYSIGSKLLQKGRHLNATLAVNTVLLCVSKREFFHQRFAVLLDTLYKYLKDPKIRQLTLACILRLQWVYLFRNPESPSSVAQKRIESILENVLPALVKPKPSGAAFPSPFLFSNESNMEHCTYIVWHVCCKYRNVGFAVIRGLIGVGEPDHEPVVVERAIVALQALLLVLRDMERGLGRDSLSIGQLDILSKNSSGDPTNGSSGVYVETKIDIPPPPFPSSVAAADVLDLAVAGERDASLRKRWAMSKLNRPQKMTLQKAAGQRRPQFDRGSLRRSYSVLSTALTASGLSGSTGLYASPDEDVASVADLLDKITDVSSTKTLNGPLSDIFEQRMGANARELLEQVNLKLTVLVLKADLLVGTQNVRAPAAATARRNLGKLGTRRSSLAEMSGPDFVTEGSDLPQSDDDTQSVSIGTVTSINSFSLTTPGQLSIREKIAVADLVRAWIEALPRIVPNGLGPNKILELLSKYTLHGDPNIARASVDALKRIALTLFENKSRAKWWLEGSKCSLVSQRVAQTFISTVFRITNDKAFDWSTNHFVSDSTPITSGFEPLAESIYTLYVGLVRLWYIQLKVSLPSNEVSRPVDVLEMTEEIESKALFALISHQATVRRLGVALLKLARSINLFSLEQSAPVPRPSNREARKSIRKSMARIQQHQSHLVTVLEEKGADLVRQYRGVDSRNGPLATSGSNPAESQYSFSHNEAYIDSDNTISLPEARDALLVKIESLNPNEAAVWFRCLPEALRLFRRLVAPHVMDRALLDMMSRLLYLYPFICAAGETRGTLASGQYQMSPLDLSMQYSEQVKMTSELLIQQSGTLLAAVCSLMTPATVPTASAPYEAAMSSSSLPKDPHTIINNPKTLFNLYFSLMYSERPFIRFAAVSALGELPRKLKPMLFYELLNLLKLVGSSRRFDESVVSGFGSRNRAGSGASGNYPGASSSVPSAGAFLHPGTSHSTGGPTSSMSPLPGTGSIGSVSKSVGAAKQAERLRMELTHLLLLNIEFLSEENAVENSASLAVAKYIESTAQYLQSPSVQAASEHQLLRCYFAQLVDAFYTHSTRRALYDLPDSSALALNSDLRYSLFNLFLCWSGHGPLGEAYSARALRIAQTMLDQVRDSAEQKHIMLVIQEQKRWLQLAASRAIASLTYDPQLFKDRQRSALGDNKPAVDIMALLGWIEATMSSGTDELFSIAEQALQNALLASLSEEESLFNNIVRMCIAGNSESKTIQCYFLATVGLIEHLSKAEFDSMPQLESFVFQLIPAYSLSRLQMAGNALVNLPTRTRATLLHFFFIARRVPLLLHLALFKLGDPSVAIRKAASKLLRIIEADVLRSDILPYLQIPNTCLPPNVPQVEQVMKALGKAVEFEDEGAVYENLALGSVSLCVYSPAKTHATMRLASTYPQYAIVMFCEGISWLELMSQSLSSSLVVHNSMKALIESLSPWLSQVSLSLAAKEKPSEPHVPSIAALIIHNMLHITTTFGDTFPETIGDLWLCLFSSTTNGAAEVNLLLEHVMELACYLKNPLFIVSVKRILTWLCRTKLCPVLSESLLRYISSKMFVPHHHMLQPALLKLKTVMWNGQVLSVAPLSSYLTEMPQRSPLSHGQLACLFLVDIVVELGPDWVLQHLPVLLHVIVIQLDHFVTMVCDHARLLLFRILSLLTPRLRLVYNVKARWIKFLSWLETPPKDGKRLWNYEDLTLAKFTLPSCEQMAALVDDIVDAFIHLQPDLDQRWGQTALKWGTCCPVRHLACRSLQIVRVLMPQISSGMLSDLAHRLSNTLSDPSDDVQGFAMEGLATMDTMIDSLKDEQTLLPPLLWMCSACLYSAHSWECSEAIRMLVKIFGKLAQKPLFPPSVVLESCPQQWSKSKFTGLFPLIFNGFNGSSTGMSDMVSQLFSHIVAYVNRLPWDPVSNPQWLDTTPFFTLRSVLGQLKPLVCAIQDEFAMASLPPISNEGLEIASGLLELATKLDSSKIVRLLQSYLRGKLLFKEEFLKQLANVIQLTFFPEHTLPILTMLLQISQSKDKEWRKVSFQLLKQIVPSISPFASGNMLFGGPALKPLVSLFRVDESETEYELAKKVISALLDVSSSNLSDDKATAWLILGGQSLHKIAIESYASDPAEHLTGRAVTESSKEGESYIKQAILNYDKSTAAICRSNMDSVGSSLHLKPVYGRRRRSSAANHPMPPFAASNVLAAATSSPIVSSGSSFPPTTTDEGTKRLSYEDTGEGRIISQRGGSLPQEKYAKDDDLLDNYFQ